LKVELLQITPDAVNFIGNCAGICYNSDTSNASNIKRAVACKDKGHLATLRFAHATFHVSNISRVCSHQFVRSKHLDFLQRSQRYCKEDKADFVYPPTTDKVLLGYYEECYKDCASWYKQLLELGVKKEDARFVLPEATTTEFIVTGNFQAWLDFIRLRADTHAQWEVRKVAVLINNILAKETDNHIFTWIPEG
jgi:thymidylate synthase (FAD)